MEWYEYLITTGMPIGAILWVGYVLKEQIKSQTKVMATWKTVVDSIDNINKVHDIETTKIKRVMSMDIDELRTQVEELANMSNKAITVFEMQYGASGQFFDRREFISTHLPNCHKIFLDTYSK